MGAGVVDGRRSGRRLASRREHRGDCGARWPADGFAEGAGAAARESSLCEYQFTTFRASGIMNKAQIGRKLETLRCFAFCRWGLLLLGQWIAR